MKFCIKGFTTKMQMQNVILRKDENHSVKRKEVFYEKMASILQNVKKNGDNGNMTYGNVEEVAML